jgi:programmed cell death protein 5
MDDPELAQIRAQRMAQMRGQQQGGGGPGGSSGNENQAEEAEKRRQEQEMTKNSILSQVLDQAARARLNTLMLAKPEKGQMVESMIVRMAKSGQIGGKMSETEFKNILEQISSRTNAATTVKFDRRRAAMDSDDDDF